MKPKQIERLKSSFKMLEPFTDTIAERFYGNLFRMAPELKKQFESADLTTQGSLMQALGVAVNGMQDQEALRPILANLGYQHASYGVKPENYDVAIEALLMAFRDTLGEQFDPELEVVWQQMLIKVTTVMIEGGHYLTNRKASEASQTRASKVVNATLDNYLARFLPKDDYDRTETDANADPDPVIEGMPQTFTVEFVGDRQVEAKPLQSILDISLKAGIAHASECGGRGKCTTCRVVVLEGLENCLHRTKPEARMAKIKGFPPELRIACQARVVGPVKVRRLVHDSTDIKEAMVSHRNSEGREMNLAVLFADIRGFTKFAEDNLPYDIVHALNRYFNAVGLIIDKHEGFIDKYMGDGVMALFGLNPKRAEHPCVDAVNAAVGMLCSLREVNEYMSAYLGHEFRIGIGIDFGTVVMGEIGFNLRKQFTAIGDTVNIASRLESETKNQEADILVSDSVRRALPNGVCRYGHSIEVALKGKSGFHTAHEVLIPVDFQVQQ